MRTFVGQQVLEAVARDRVGVAAAELHEVIDARRARPRARSPPRSLRQRAVAIFVDVFHGYAPPSLRPARLASRNAQRVGRASVRVPPPPPGSIAWSSGVADVQHDVVADLQVLDQRRRDDLDDAVEADLGHFVGQDFASLAREWRDTWSHPPESDAPARSSARAKAAWPSDTPPSLAGTARGRIAASGRARATPRRDRRPSTRFIRQPPPSAIRVEPARRGRRADPVVERGDQRAVEQLRRLAAAQALRRSIAANSGAESSRPASMRHSAGAGARASRPAPRAPSPPGLRSAGRGTRRRAPPRRRTAGRGWWSSGTRAPRAKRCGEPRRVGRVRASSRAAASSRPSRRSAATPMRHGSRAARSPPGSASGSRWPTRRQSAPSSVISSPPHGAPSVP